MTLEAPQPAASHSRISQNISSGFLLQLESARGSAPEAEVHVAELGQAAREGGGGGSSSPAQQCQAALEYVQVSRRHALCAGTVGTSCLGW